MDTTTLNSNIAFIDTDGGRRRFLLELEFLQLLANPTYIHYLAQNRYFDDPAFVNYLKYLQYWRKPEYANFIMYPHSLFFLELLQSQQFRTAMAHHNNKEIAHRQQFYFWRHYRNNRLKILQEEAKALGGQDAQSKTPIEHDLLVKVEPVTEAVQGQPLVTQGTKKRKMS